MASASSMTTGRAMLREVSCQIGELSRAEGCARYRQGNTEVLCSLSGPLQAMDRVSDSEQAVVEVLVRGRDDTVRSGGATRGTMESERYEETLSTSELASVVKACMETAIDVHLFPRQKLVFTLQVIQDDGSLTSIAVNAAMLAAIDSGIPCTSTVAACDICAVDSKLILDPTTEDRSSSQAFGFFAHVTSTDGGVVASSTGGPAMGQDLFWLFHKTTKNAAQTLFKLFAKFMQEQKGANKTDTDAV